jgi:hypothetical protein
MRDTAIQNRAGRGGYTGQSIRDAWRRPILMVKLYFLV